MTTMTDDRDINRATYADPTHEEAVAAADRMHRELTALRAQLAEAQQALTEARAAGERLRGERDEAIAARQHTAKVADERVAAAREVASKDSLDGYNLAVRYGAERDRERTRADRAEGELAAKTKAADDHFAWAIRMRDERDDLDKLVRQQRAQIAALAARQEGGGR